MLPEFDQQGFLPEGVWTCGLVEFVKTFAVFRRSDRRLILFEKLESLLKETLATGWVQEIIIDGSFVTKKDEPGDIDLLLGLSPEFDDAEVSYWTGKILDGTFLSKKYRFDVKVRKFGSPAYYEWLDFFQEVKDSDERKGVVRLTL
jgi:hypothetical protein